ncbi:hypothetical protein AB0B07_34905 [Streptomyces sioyaensis]
MDIQTGSWRPGMGNSDTQLEGQIGIPQAKSSRPRVEVGVSAW